MAGSAEEEGMKPVSGRDFSRRAVLGGTIAAVPVSAAAWAAERKAEGGKDACTGSPLSLRSANNRLPHIDPGKTALVVVDLQVGFVEPGAPFALAAARHLPDVAMQMAPAVRAAGGKVVWTRHGYAAEGSSAIPAWQYEWNPAVDRLRRTFVPGTAAHALDRRIAPAADDLVVDKFRYSAFAPHSSDLHDRLQRAGVDTLAIMGCATHTCCESTARDGYALGYKIIMLTDANAAPSEVETMASLHNLGIVCADLRTVSEFSGAMRSGGAWPAAPAA